MNILTPGENKRLNELIGFLWAVAAVLVGLSLVSYSPLDPSLNTATPPLEPPAQNWIGIVGAYLADLLLQALGYVAFLLPVLLVALTWQWFRSRAVASPVAKVSGVLLLLFSLTCLLGLMPSFPGVHGLIPAGGLLGVLLALGLTQVANVPGAFILTLSCLIVGAYLATPFSFLTSTAWLREQSGSAAPLWERLRNLSLPWPGWRLPWRREATPAPGPAILRTRVQPTTTRAVDISAPMELPAPAGPKPSKARPQPVPEDEWDEPEIPGEKPIPVEPRLTKAVPVARARYRLPSAALLRPPEHVALPNETELQQRAETLTQKLEEFDVRGQVTQINPGPVVTTFEFRPQAGVKLSRITNLAEDLCLGLRAEAVLIERIPGKSTVGIEVPNSHRETIALREIIESQEFAASASKLTVALGKDLAGRVRIADLALMPHLLIAGSTGSGKSVAINSMIISMLYKAHPDEVKFILIDPKRLELGLYENVPHLFTPIVTDPKLAANALRNATREMERRLKVLAEAGTRNIEQYNRLLADEDAPAGLAAEGDERGPLPYIVIVIDELADLMLIDTPNVEESVTRLAQMARAVGIHLILATQRPSVDVITGLIKANFPARISFRVATKVDSRTILDANGAEALLGRGDMLYLPAGSARLHRVHGPLVTESEIVHVCDFWRAQAKPHYHEEFLRFPKEPEREAAEDAVEVDDELYEEAVRIVCELGKASTSTLQRRLRIGYGRAARLIDMMQQEGLVGPPDGSKPREVIRKRDFSRA
ncbi:MAG: DNA translocase FtsK 4TM domain-containing protein [Acidobacteria bacterium]|nr:DNA translocase FtsK 4TM domain-containing protein [Acidobacteriota bacterium]